MKFKSNYQQDCSFQGEALIISTAFQGLWSSSNMKKLNIKNEIKKKWVFFVKIIPPRAIWSKKW